MLLSNLGSTLAFDLCNPNIVWRKKYQKTQVEWLNGLMILLYGVVVGGRRQ